ncbi:hypothetical protein [Psychroflexus planctonicus]|mgnify:CR=1 FL=1|nr:hypothetical protein [Psychroflexus planctonicus]
MKKNSIAEQAKEDFVESILSSKALAFAKYALLGVGVIYGLGFVFKVLAYAKSNFNDLTQTMQSNNSN